MSQTLTEFSSALFLLYSFDEPGGAEPDSIYDPDHPLSKSAHTCLGLSRIYNNSGGQLSGTQRASPFLLCWGHRSFKYFYDRYNLDGHRQSLEALDDMRRAMDSLGKKWKLAGAQYLSLAY